MSKTIFMVGAFPPPIHGMAAVNEAYYRILKERKIGPKVINLSLKALDRTHLGRLKRFPRALIGLIKIATDKSAFKGTMYISISGGLGQAYEILFVVLARIYLMRIFMHHHSFAYISTPRILTKVLIHIAGTEASHIALSTGMSNQLKEKYPTIHNIRTVSNSVLISNKKNRIIVERSRLETIGYFGNITKEKGIYEFIEIVKKLEKLGLNVKARIAGPFVDERTEQKVSKLIENMETVEYLGPQYDDAKNEFYRSIDLLVFPSRYINEAEPLTIYEAMQYSIPVVTYGVGCIPEMVNEKTGLVVNPSKEIIIDAIDTIKEWLESPEKFRQASINALNVFNTISVNNKISHLELVRDLTEIAVKKIKTGI